MLRKCIVLILSAGFAHAQSRVDLLQRVAQHYQTAENFEVKGTASALLPGTSWKVSYSFDTQGIQPAFLPLETHTSEMQDLYTMGGFVRTRKDPQASDPFPGKPLTMHPFGAYHRLTRRMLDADQTGTEAIVFDGRAHACEIIDASFDESPEFRPKSVIAHVRFWIDPAQLTVLREQRSFDGVDWTAEVTSYSFDQPVSAETVKSLQGLANRPKDRPEWVGRTLPDLTFQQLSGPSITLADLHGKPVLLEFWGSYCPPCKVAALHAQQLARRYRASGLMVVTLTQDNAEDARLWASHNHLNLPIVLDKAGAAFKAFDVNGIPVAILADANGKVVHYWTGFDDPAEMDTLLSTALEARPAAKANSPRLQ
jgi:peroxiredoxin